jgi:hypothetical protein
MHAPALIFGLIMGGIHRLGMGRRNSIAIAGRLQTSSAGAQVIHPAGLKKDPFWFSQSKPLVATTGMVSIMLIVAFYRDDPWSLSVV